MKYRGRVKWKIRKNKLSNNKIGNANLKRLICIEKYFKSNVT